VISTIENEEQLAELITEQPQEINLNVENEISNTEQQLSTTICETIKLKNEKAYVMRTRAKKNLKNQAKKIMAWSDKKLLLVAAHSNIRVLVSEVDKRCLGSRRYWLLFYK